MAKIEFAQFDAYQDVLRELELSVPKIIKPAIYNGAAIVADEVKRSLRRTLGGRGSGDLERSMGLAEMRDDFGYIHTKIGFKDYDRRRQPNVVKARVLEGGRKAGPKNKPARQKKTPFIAPAVKAARERAERAMEDTVDQQIQNIMEKKNKEG